MDVGRELVLEKDIEESEDIDGDKSEDLMVCDGRAPSEALLSLRVGSGDLTGCTG